MADANPLTNTGKRLNRLTDRMCGRKVLKKNNVSKIFMMCKKFKDTEFLLHSDGLPSQPIFKKSVMMHWIKGINKYLTEDFL